MKRIIYLGMENKPYTVYETAHVKNFKVVYQYENDNGKKVMLKALKNVLAYNNPVDHKQYINNYFKPLQENKLYSIDILNNGYDPHHFELVEV